MEQFGFLFQEGAVTKDDLEYLHSVPPSVQKAALHEYSKNHPLIHSVPKANSFTLRQMYEWGDFKQEDMLIDDSTHFTRLQTMVESAQIIIESSDVHGNVIRMIEADVSTTEKLNRVLDVLAAIVMNHKDYQTALFVLTEVIPMKLEDYHMTGSIGIRSKEDNVFKELWNQLLESWHEENYQEVASSLQAFAEIFGMSEDTKKNIWSSFCTGISPTISMDKYLPKEEDTSGYQKEEVPVQVDFLEADEIDVDAVCSLEMAQTLLSQQWNTICKRFGMNNTQCPSVREMDWASVVNTMQTIQGSTISTQFDPSLQQHFVLNCGKNRYVMYKFTCISDEFVLLVPIKGNNLFVGRLGDEQYGWDQLL